MKDLNYYLALPYVATIRPDEEGGFVARFEDLPGCSADGATAAEALERLDDLKRDWIEDALEAGHPVPEPALEEDLPSGKWVQRVPRSLHRKLSRAAKKDGVSLNALVCTVLAEAVGSKAASESSSKPAVLAPAQVSAAESRWSGGCYEVDSGWIDICVDRSVIVTNHSCSESVPNLGLADRLHLLGNKFPGNSRKNFKVFYDQEKIGEFRKA